MVDFDRKKILEFCLVCKFWCYSIFSMRVRSVKLKPIRDEGKLSTVMNMLARNKFVRRLRMASLVTDVPRCINNTLSQGKLQILVLNN